MAKLPLEIDIETKTAIREMRSFGLASDRLTKSLSKGFRDSAGAFNSFVGNIGANAVTGAFNQLTSAAQGLFDTFVFEGVAAAQVQEDAVNDLNAALRRGGEFSEEMSQDMQAFASSLQEVTKFGDEAILGQLAFAQSMGASAEQAKAVVSAGADLAASLNIDLNSAVRNVAKTLGGYAGELGEVIPELKNLTAEQLQAGEAIDLLAEKFRGAASAQIQTFSGGTTQLSNTFGDLQEEIGSIITQNPAFLEAIGQANKVLLDLQDFVKDNKDELKALAADGLVFLIELIPSTIGFIEDLSASFTKLKNAATGVASFLGLTELDESNDRLDRLNRKLEANLKLRNKIAEKLGEDDVRLQKIDARIKRTQDEIGVEIERQGKIVEGDNLESASDKKRQKFLEDFKKKSKETTDSAIEDIRRRQEAEFVGPPAPSDLPTPRLDAKKREFEGIAALEEAERLRQEEQRAEQEILEEEDRAKQDEKFEEFKKRRMERVEFEKQLTEEERALQKKRDEQDKKEAAKRDKAERDQIFKRKEFEKKTNREKVQDLQSTLSNIEGLQQSNNKTLFAAGKAAAIANAVIRGAEAAVLASTALPPPFNLPLIALVVANTAEQIGRIKGQQPPGRQQGGFVDLNNPSDRDNTFIQAAGSELLLNRRQQTDLFNAITSGNIGSSNNTIVIEGNVIADDESQVNQLIDRINDQIEFRNATLNVG